MIVAVFFLPFVITPALGYFIHRARGGSDLSIEIWNRIRCRSSALMLVMFSVWGALIVGLTSSPSMHGPFKKYVAWLCFGLFVPLALALGVMMVADAFSHFFRKRPRR